MTNLQIYYKIIKRGFMGKEYIDLHVHSIFSDGYMSISELVQMAKSNNVKTFAISDHDDVRNFEILKPLAKKYNLNIVSAVELSTYYICPSDCKARKVHLLGYGIDIYNSKLVELMQTYKNKRFKANIEMLNNILQIGINVPNCIFDEVKFENYLSIATEMKRVLVKNDYDYEFVKNFIDKVKPFVPNYKNYEIDIFKALQLIQYCGGVAVLAHPQEIKLDFKEKDFLIKKLKAKGLKGVEVYHADASQSEMAENLKLANENQLLISVGSDYHRPDKNNKTIGTGINNNLLKSSCSLVDYLEDNNMFER